VCDISGYGDEGPYRSKKAYDLLIQSEAGLLSVTGTEEYPSKAGISIADISAGMYAYSGILAALLQRERTGKGTRVEISMFETLAEWMGHPLYYSGFGGAPLHRTGARHATIVPYGPFAAGDGKTVMLGIQNEREWKTFCEEVLRRPDLCRDFRFESNSHRLENGEELAEIIREAFASLSRDQVIERLEAAQIANAQMNEVGEVFRHPQLAARGRWREVETPAGRIPALLPPATFSGFEARMGPVPALGEHSQAILSELGFTIEEIARMRDSKLILNSNGANRQKEVQ
jgi:crotonobetainyl-CoA:carnitine CoA-transferase CaiB-like acyl-CoA transferase